MNVAALQKQKAERLDQAKAIKTAAVALSRDLSDEEWAKFEALVAEAKGFDEQIQAAQKREDAFAAFDQMHAGLDQVPAPRSQPQSQDVSASRVQVRPAWEDDPKMGFRSERDFYQAVHRAGKFGQMPENLKALQAPRAAAGSDEGSTFSDPDGGFLIPSGFSPNLLSRATEEDPTVGRVMDMPMQMPEVDIPARVDSDHSNSVSGGLRFYRRAESQSVSSSKPTHELVKIQAHSLMGLSYHTEELLRDSPLSVAALLERSFSEEYASKIMDEKLNGTGVGEMLGVINAPCTVSVAKEAAQAADTINGTNIIKMRARCWRYGQAIWIANHDTLPQLAEAHLSGTNGDVFLFRPGNGEDVPATLLGRPIFFSEYAKTVGDAGDLVLGVWSEYIVGQYEPLQNAESIHVRFVNHERAFKFWSRIGGRPWWRSALTPKNGANTLSCFVTLAARA